MSKNDAILITLASIQEKYKKGYCYPSQERIMAIIREIHGITMSRSTLNRVLRRVEDQGYFKRTRRIQRGKNGKILFRSTLYTLKAKTYQTLGKLQETLKKIFTVFRVPFPLHYIKSSIELSTSKDSKVASLVDKLVDNLGGGTM